MAITENITLNHWTKGNHDRTYINEWEETAGLEIDRYKTGNISQASLKDVGKISNREAGRLLNLAIYIDNKTGELHISNKSGARTKHIEIIKENIKSVLDEITATN